MKQKIHASSYVTELTCFDVQKRKNSSKKEATHALSDVMGWADAAGVCAIAGSPTSVGP